YPAFDYWTISDLILHVRYTARLGVEQARVESALHDLFAEVSATAGANLALLFSLTYDFPTEWSAFVNGTGSFSATIRRDAFPYFAQGRNITINELQLYGKDVSRHHAVDDPAARTTDLHDTGAFTLTLPPDAPGPTQVLTRTPGSQAFLVVQYSM